MYTLIGYYMTIYRRNPGHSWAFQSFGYAIYAVYQNGREKFVVCLGKAKGIAHAGEIVSELSKRHSVEKMERVTLFSANGSICEALTDKLLIETVENGHVHDQEIIEQLLPFEEEKYWKIGLAFSSKEEEHKEWFDDSKSLAKQEFMLLDGRQVKAEAWAEDGYTFLTYRFSSGGIENITLSDLIDYLNCNGMTVDEKYKTSGASFRGRGSLTMDLTLTIGESEE